MNTDGFALLERLQRSSDPELIKLINRCAVYARAKKDVELIEFNSRLAGTKVFAEVVTVHLLQRLLNNLT